MKERGGGTMMRKFVLLFACCVQNCASQSYTGKCAHDPSAKALTHELLEQGYEAYKDIECVPAYLFCQCQWRNDCATGRGYGSKEVEIKGKLNSLLRIEQSAFRSFAGKITWSADTPNLKELGRSAFYASNAASMVTFATPMTSLETIGDYAFGLFAGEIAFNATFPKLKEVGREAFYKVSNPASTVVLDNAPLLETIGGDAFREFKGNVQLVGEFSRLRSIGWDAFSSASNAGSRVEIRCASDEGLVVDDTAFLEFRGTRIKAGEDVGCSDYITTTSTITSTTTTVTTTTTATTSTSTTATTTTTTSTTTTSITTTTTTATTTTTTSTTTTSITTTTTTATTTTKHPSCYPRLAFAPSSSPPASATSPPTAWGAIASVAELTATWPTSLPVKEPVVLNGLPDDFFRRDNVVRENYTADCLEDHPELKSATNPAALDTDELSYQLRWTKAAASDDSGTTTTTTSITVANNDPTFVGKPPPEGVLVLSGESGAANDTKALTIAASGKIMWLPQEVGTYTMWLVGGFFGSRDASLHGLFGTDSETTIEDDQIVAAIWNFEITEKQAFSVTSFSRAIQDSDGNPYSLYNGYTDMNLPAKDGNGGGGDEPMLDCAVNSTYKVAPIDPATVLTSTQTEGSKLEYSLRNAPNGFFVDGSNGEILAVPTEPTFQNGTANASGIVIAELVATNPTANGGGQAVVQNISIRIRYKDEATPAYGPNNKECANGIAKDDDNLFDKTFACDCTGTIYTGDNCETEKVTVKTCPAEDETLVAGECETFKLEVEPRAPSDGYYTNPGATAEKYYIVGNTYRIAPINISDSTKTSTGTISDITFLLEGTDANEAPFFAKSGTGEFIATFAEKDAGKTYNFKLVARDAGGAQVDVEMYTMKVVSPGTFQVDSFQRKDAENIVQSVDIDSTETKSKNCSFNAECFVNGIVDNSLSPKPNGTVAYTVQVDKGDGDNGCDLTLLIDPDTGYMSGKYTVAEKNMTRDQNVTCTATLSAVETNGNLPPQTVKLETFDILFRPEDTAVAANGPNGEACANSGKSIDGNPFDKTFACDCTGTIYTGDNCETEKVTVKTCPAEDETLVAGECETFKLEVEPRAPSDGYYTNPGATAEKYYIVGNTYRIAPINISDSTKTSTGTISDITFLLEGIDANEAPFFAKSGTGEFIATFAEKDAGKTYNFKLVARDAGGAQVDVEMYTMKVVSPGTFQVDSFQRKDAENIVQSVDIDSTETNSKNCSFNAECFVNGIVDNSLRPKPNGTVAYTVQVEKGDGDNGCDLTLLIDPDTGYMSGKYNVAEKNMTRDQNVTCTATLSAVETNGNLPPQTVKLETFDILFRPEDTAVAANGPGGQMCANGGLADDGTLYDKTFTCDCSNTKFNGNRCSETTPAAAGAAASTSTSVWIVIGVFIALLLLVGAGYKYRVHALSMQVFDFEKQMADMTASGELDPVLDGSDGGGVGPRLPREIKRAHVILTAVLGHGAFGEVWKAVLDESKAGGVPGYLVAVKTSKDATGDGADELRKEALVMAQVTGHPNVVALVGVVTSGVPLLLLLSLCDNGSLLSTLKEKKWPSQQFESAPSAVETLKIALEIARGMDHLVKAKFVHRDLAARNVLVDSQFICKIADFGLSRGIGALNPDDANAKEYYTSHGGAFPVRWTAPEAIETMKYSTATDVWSYGIVLLEIVSGGKRPYDEKKNNEVVQGVLAGYRAPRPDPGCTVEFYTDVMLKCWSEEPKARPTFQALVPILEQQMAQQVAQQGGDGEYNFPDGYSPASSSNAPAGGGGGGSSAGPANQNYLVPGVQVEMPAAPNNSQDYLVPGVHMETAFGSSTAESALLGGPEYEEMDDASALGSRGAEASSALLGGPEYEEMDDASMPAGSTPNVPLRAAGSNAPRSVVGTAFVFDNASDPMAPISI